MSILFLTSAVAALGLVETPGAEPPVWKGPPPTCSLEGSFRLRDLDGAEKAPPFGEVFVQTPLPGLGSTKPEAFEIAQKNRAFVPNVLVVKVNDTVAFPNRDIENHEVHSDGEVNSFVVKRSSREVSKHVEFSVAGVSRIECSIHSNMRAIIRTVPNSFHVSLKSDGKWKISGLPQKSLEVVFWWAGEKEPTRLMLKPCVSPFVSVTLQVDSLPALSSSGGIYQPF